MTFQQIVTVCAVCLTLAFTGWESMLDETNDTTTDQNIDDSLWGGFTLNLPDNGILGCCEDESDCDWAFFRLPSCDKVVFEETTNCWSMKNILTLLSIIIHVSFFMFDVLRQNGFSMNFIHIPGRSSENSSNQSVKTALNVEIIEKDHKMRLEEMAKTVEYVSRQRRDMETERQRQAFTMNYPPMVTPDSLLTHSPEQRNETSANHSSSEESVSGEPRVDETTRKEAEFDDPDYEWDLEYGIG